MGQKAGSDYSSRCRIGRWPSGLIQDWSCFVMFNVRKKRSLDVEDWM